MASSPRETVAIGKATLLSWCAEISQMRCSRLEDLKNGVVLLAVLFKVFPRLVEKKLRMRWAPRFDHEVVLNWDAIEHAVNHLRLPGELFDREGLMATRFRPAYNLLVALYFLQQVSISSDFTADFSHPIDPALASFLQSRAAVESMIAGGAIGMPGGGGGDDEAEAETPYSPKGSTVSPSPGHTPQHGHSNGAAVLADETPDADALAAVAELLLTDDTEPAPNATAPRPSAIPVPRRGQSPTAPLPPTSDLFTQRPLFSTAAVPSPPTMAPPRTAPTEGRPPATGAATNNTRRQSASAEKKRPASGGRVPSTLWRQSGGLDSPPSLRAPPRAAHAAAANGSTPDKKSYTPRDPPRSAAIVDPTRPSVQAHHPRHPQATNQHHRHNSPGPPTSASRGGGRGRGRGASSAALAAAGAGSGGAAALALRSEVTRLEAQLSAVAAELSACRRVHSIELLTAREANAQQSSRQAELSSAAAAAASEAIAEARMQFRRDLADELQQVEAEMLDAYGAAAGPDALQSLQNGSDGGAGDGEGGAFLRRLVSVQSRQIANLHAQLEEANGRYNATAGTTPSGDALALINAGEKQQKGFDVALSAALAARTEEVNGHWQAEVEALRLALLRMQQGGGSASAIQAGQQPPPALAAPSTAASGTMVDELLTQNARLRRAADFLRKRHKEMTAAPSYWTEASPLPAADEAVVAGQVRALMMQNDHLDGASDEAEVARQVIEMLQQQRSPHGVEGGDDEEEDDELPDDSEAIEARAASLYSLLVRHGGQVSGGIETGFWQLIAALCVEERRRRLAMSRVRQLRKLTSDEVASDTHALQEAKMRAHRAEMALQVAVAQERGLASRAEADGRMRLSLAEARSEELSASVAQAEMRYGESIRALQASHTVGWKGMQQKLLAMEGEVRKLKTRDGMWAQLCEKQRQLAGKYAMHSKLAPKASAVEQRQISELADEVAAWERSLMRPAGGSQADAAVDEDDGFGGTVVSSAVSEEAEILQRVDEATAALTAEVETLREELQKTKARQLELAESAATFQAQSVGISEEVASANVRCEALHAAGQQGLQRIAALEAELGTANRAVKAAKKAAESAAYARNVKNDERDVMGRLATLAMLTRQASGGVQGLPPATPMPTRQPTQMYVDQPADDNDSVYTDTPEDEQTDGDGIVPPMPSRQASQRSATLYYVMNDEDDEDDKGDVSAELLPPPPPPPPMASRQPTQMYLDTPAEDDDSVYTDTPEDEVEPPLPTHQASRATVYYVQPPDPADAVAVVDEYEEEASEQSTVLLEDQGSFRQPAWQPPPIVTEYYIAEDVEDDDEDEEDEEGEDEGGNGGVAPPPARQRSTEYYVVAEEDEDDEEEAAEAAAVEEPSILLPLEPNAGLTASAAEKLAATAAAMKRADELAQVSSPGRPPERVVEVSLTVKGKEEKVLVEVEAGDTPSSVAVDLVEELGIEATPEALQAVVKRVAEAMEKE